MGGGPGAGRGVLRRRRRAPRGADGLRRRDVKQSIFSFQRADPSAFQAMRDYFSARARAAERHWDDVGADDLVPLDRRRATADRSGLATPAAADASASTVGRSPRPFRVGQPGWSSCGRRGTLPRIDPPPWAPPVRRVAGDSPSARLAKLDRGPHRAMIGVDRLPAAIARCARRLPGPGCAGAPASSRRYPRAEAARRAWSPASIAWC